MIDKVYKALLIIRTINNFFLAFKDKLGFVNGEIIYKINKTNLKFIARGGTEDMPEIVVVNSGYEYDFTNIRLRRSPIILDLGGHIGSFSLYVAKKYKDRAKIITFEPDKENFNLLKRNLLLNKISSVKVSNLAISNRNGKGYLKSEKMNTDAYHLEISKKKSNCLVATLPSALKNFNISKIDLIKMDVEGEEYNILLHKETLDFIKKNAHYMFIEYHTINRYKNYSVIREIVENNFKIIKKTNNILNLENINFKN